MYSLHEVFKTAKIDTETFEVGCKKAGTNLELGDIYRLFDKYSYEDGENVFLDYEKIDEILEDKKPAFITKFR